MPDQENNTSLTQLDCYFIEYSIKITCIDVQMFKIPLLKKNEWKVPIEGVKVDIFAPRAQQVGLVTGFWCF